MRAGVSATWRQISATHKPMWAPKPCSAAMLKRAAALPRARAATRKSQNSPPRDHRLHRRLVRAGWRGRPHLVCAPVLLYSAAQQAGAASAHARGAGKPLRDESSKLLAANRQISTTTRWPRSQSGAAVRTSCSAAGTAAGVRAASNGRDGAVFIQSP
jgi:hypothetical protein